MGEPLKLATVNPDDLIERVSNGEVPSRIATELGVTKAAVYYHLSDHPDYHKARKTGMAIRLDQAETKIDCATDQLSLAQGREAFRAIAWRAEHEFPDLWGKQAGISININQMVTIEGALSSAASSLLDQLRTVAEVPKSEPESVQNPEQLE